MNVEANSHEIISECLKHYGKGQCFSRTDGLQFEARRAELRRAYLESHPDLEEEFRKAILAAAAIPGMTRDQVVAAWGLLEEDTRLVFGNVTEDRLSAYGYFTGFNVGACHALYLKDDVVVGIRETEELVPPHAQELDMRFAEEDQGVHFFYDGDDGQVRGSDVDQFHIDWDTLHLHLYSVELVRPSSPEKIEQHIRKKGLIREYEIAFLRLGYYSQTAPEEVRSRIALCLLPYTGLHRTATIEQEAPLTDRDVAPRGPIALPRSALASEETSGFQPPAEWLAHIAEHAQQQAIFPSEGGGRELLKVEWKGGRIFRVDQIPCWVNAVSLYDLVEVDWSDEEIVPLFKRVAERSGLRTIRAVVNDPKGTWLIERFADINFSDPKRYRIDKRVLALTIEEPKLDDIAKEWLSYLPVSWSYTDTLTQD
jgi:hypothetical protein